MRVVLTRRHLLRRAGYGTLAFTTLPLLAACDDSSSRVCTDPQMLSRGEAQMRETLKYVEISNFDSQRCSSCQFFGKPDTAGCGHCEILDSAVSKGGHCTSWAEQG